VAPAVPGDGTRFINDVRDIAVLESTDGLHHEFADVLARVGDCGVDCIEDPRVQIVRSRGLDRHVMTYTNLPADDRRSRTPVDGWQEYWNEHLAALDDHTIVRPSNGSPGIGAGAPSVATDEGLLAFFHEHRSDGVYAMNQALLGGRTGRPVGVLPKALLVPEPE